MADSSNVITFPKANKTRVAEMRPKANAAAGPPYSAEQAILHYADCFEAWAAYIDTAYESGYISQYDIDQTTGFLNDVTWRFRAWLQ
ncbi:MAG: hypothetical protein AB2705_22295 [Candidatus Thiodiazotropha sp.]